MSIKDIITSNNLRLGLLNILYASITFAVFYLLSRKLELDLSEEQLLGLAIITNPPFIGGMFFFIRLLHWDTASFKVARISDERTRAEASIRLCKLNTSLLHSMENVSRSWFFSTSVPIALYISRPLYHHAIVSASVNSTQSAEEDSAYERALRLAKYRLRIAHYVSGYLNDPSSSDKLLKSAMDCFPSKVVPHKILLMLEATAEDGDGYLSTLSFLFRISLFSILTEQTQAKVLNELAQNEQRLTSLGWLCSRIFELALFQAIFSHSTLNRRITVSKIVNHVLNLSQEKDIEISQLNKIKWNLRNDIIRELSRISGLSVS